MPHKYISFNQHFTGLRFSRMVIWKNINRSYRESAIISGLAGNDRALALPTGSRFEFEAYDFFEPEDFISFETLLQIFALEGHGSYIAEAVKREVENYLAYCKNDSFFEQLKFFYEPNEGDHILVMDDRVANNIVIFKGLFLR